MPTQKSQRGGRNYLLHYLHILNLFFGSNHLKSFEKGIYIYINTMGKSRMRRKPNRLNSNFQERGELGILGRVVSPSTIHSDSVQKASHRA